MDEIEKRPELTMNVMDATSIPHFSSEKLRDESCRKISLGQLTAFGVAFEPLVAAIWTIVNKKDTIFKYIFWERLDSLPIPESCFHFVWCQIA